MSLLLGNDWHVRTWLCNPAVVCEHPISINVASEHQYWRANWEGLGGAWLAGNLQFSKDAQRYSIPYAWCLLLWQKKQNVHNSPAPKGCEESQVGGGLEIKAWSCPCLVRSCCAHGRICLLTGAVQSLAPRPQLSPLQAALSYSKGEGVLRREELLLRIKAVTVPTCSVCLWLLKHLLDCGTWGLQEARSTALPQEGEERRYCYRRKIES